MRLRNANSGRAGNQQRHARKERDSDEANAMHLMHEALLEL
jgi:hypothetical protein